MARISASILSFLFDAEKRKQSSQAMIENINAALKEKDKDFDILHLDIEDGKFVKHKSFKTSELRKIRCGKKREAHLMVLDYKKYLKDYFELADMFIFHQEVIKKDFPEVIGFLKNNKKFVGISISPDTPIDEIKYLDQVNLILVMSVYPGEPGQRFIGRTLARIRKLVNIRKKKKLYFTIEVDGGINKENMQGIIDAGADILVMGTGLFKS
jgi:ribulose-phosphate 3-epimerase